MVDSQFVRIEKLFNIENIADSGQIFRFYKIDKGTYDLFHEDKRLRINVTDQYYVFNCDKKTYDSIYKKYFDEKFLNDSYFYVENILSKKDKFLKCCCKEGKGLRILNQDPYEMLISFIISQRKSIKAIQTSIEKLCKLCGKKKKDKFGEYYAFPSPIGILSKSDKLSSCSLGYRVPYVIDACEKIVEKEINLYSNKINKLTDEELTNYLMRVKGVGIKVASCVALFAYHRLSVCPIDVWIKRVLDKYYKGKIPLKYKKYAGLIQQYWFICAKNKEVTF